MAVLGRLLISSAERLDLPDLLSVDSYAAGDWKYFLKGLVGDSKPYILKGFDVIDPQNAVGTQSCSVRVAESVVFYPGSNTGSFYHGLPEGDSNALPLVPELRKNAVNYVYLTFSTFNTSVDTRAFWDPDKDTGLGGEFTQDVNTESVLKIDVNVSTGSFPANTIPIAKVTVGSVVITAIEDARDMMFRLGSGGISPNPYNQYNFRSLPSAPYQRSEPSGSMTSSADPNPFQGADKNIYSLKEWMDVVMTKLMEIGGTVHWYENTSTFSLVSMFHDVLATTFKSKGTWQHSSSTPGLITWTEDLFIKGTADPKDVIIKAGNKTLTDEQVMYLPLVRNQAVNVTDAPVAWTNSQSYVNTIGGSVGSFAFLTKGDWIKKAGDGWHLFVRVEEFYDSVNLGGSVTTAALAKSVRLNTVYQGVTSNDRARYDQGVYQAADVQVDDRDSTNLTDAGGNFHWLAVRSDTIEGISSIQGFTLTGNVATVDGERAKVVVTAHGLEDGDIVTVTAPVGHAGSYSVDVTDANTFYISSANLTTGAFTGHYALCTTAARTNGYGLTLETATHNFDTGETIIIDGTTNFDGAYVINARSTTQFQFGFTSAAVETSGTATLARINLRAEEGLVKVVQGETISIGQPDTDNIRHFIGMASLAEIRPNYYTSSSYNTLAGFANFNGALNDSLTERVSKLTSMMADKAQDKTVQLLAADTDFCDNTTSGSDQIVAFSSFGAGTPTLNVVLPHTITGTITLSGSLTLAANQAAYFAVDRNDAFSFADLSALTIANLEDVPVDENVFIFCSRLSTTDIWLWDGKKVKAGGSALNGGDGTGVIVTLYDPVSTTLTTGSPVIVDGITIVDKDTVLFSNLSLNNNRIYKATVVAGDVTAWTPLGIFKTGLNPANSESVIFAKGDAFKQQIALFDGTTFKVNETVRYFTGVDYWEVSAIKTATLVDNASGNVFTTAYANSENMIVEYSLLRGTTKEVGTLHITTDGTSVAVTTSGAYIGSNGVSFTGDISGSDLRLRYTTSASGDSATMKYYVKRWSNSAGGPGGIPSYTGGGAGSGAPAGSSGDIQYNASGTLAGNSNFKLDTALGVLNLNGLEISTLISTPLLDNQGAAVNLFGIPTSYKFAIVEYSVDKSGSYRVGRLLVTNDGTNVSISDDYVEQNASGVLFSAVISGGNANVQYVSSNAGSDGTFKYSVRRWT